MKRKFRQKKSLREIESRINYSGERSPYWDFLSSHQRFDAEGQMQEDSIANPDVLSEEDTLFKNDSRMKEEKDLKLRVIQEVIPTLSPQQKLVLQLCGFNGATLKEAAKELKIKIPTVQVFLNRIREKILKRYTELKKQLEGGI